MNWQYSSGVGRGGGTLVNGWKGAVLKGWTVTNNISISSGTPLTAIVGGARSTTTGTGITGSLRANATGLAGERRSGGPTVQLPRRSPFRWPGSGATRDAIPLPDQCNSG